MSRSSLSAMSSVLLLMRFSSTPPPAPPPPPPPPPLPARPVTPPASQRARSLPTNSLRVPPNYWGGLFNYSKRCVWNNTLPFLVYRFTRKRKRIYSKMLGRTSPKGLNLCVCKSNRMFGDIWLLLNVKRRLKVSSRRHSKFNKQTTNRFSGIGRGEEGETENTFSHRDVPRERDRET